MKEEATNLNSCFDNKSSVVAFSYNECHDKSANGVADSDEMLFSMRRPQGFMTAYKDRKILMTVTDSEATHIDLKPAKEQTTPYVNLSVTNMRQQPLLDFQQSSLLVEGGCKMTGLFAGDRFIPYRPEETHLDGWEQYKHEENLMNSNLLRIPRHHRRNDDDANMSSDSNSRRSHSTPSSNTSSNSSHNSNRSASERVHRASRRRQLAYENLLNQTCFQDHDRASQ